MKYRICCDFTVISVNESDIKKATSFVYLWHMANPGSLKPFKKGHDPRRNVKGRISKPLSESGALKKYLLKHLHKKVTVNGVQMRMMDLVAERLVDDAVRGSISALKILLDRTEGKVMTQAQMAKVRDKEERKLSAAEDKEMLRVMRLFATEEELKKLDAQDSTKS